MIIKITRTSDEMPTQDWPTKVQRSALQTQFYQIEAIRLKINRSVMVAHRHMHILNLQLLDSLSFVQFIAQDFAWHSGKYVWHIVRCANNTYLK